MQATPTFKWPFLSETFWSGQVAWTTTEKFSSSLIAVQHVVTVSDTVRTRVKGPEEIFVS